MSTRPSREEVDDLARTLMEAWKQAEGTPVTASHVATFVDMARAVLARDEDEFHCELCGSSTHDTMVCQDKPVPARCIHVPGCACRGVGVS